MLHHHFVLNYHRDHYQHMISNIEIQRVIISQDNKFNYI